MSLAAPIQKAAARLLRAVDGTYQVGCCHTLPSTMDDRAHVQGFKVFLFQFEEGSSSQHHVFAKEHSVREKVPEKPADRTLFLVNVPPYSTEEGLKNVFSHCGPVESVFFHEKPTSAVPPIEESQFFPNNVPVKGFKIAYVVFETAAGLHTALNLDTTIPLILSTDDHRVVTGLKKWCKDYNAQIPDDKALQEEVKTFMMGFDKDADLEHQADKDKLIPDEDGWVTVTRKGRRPGFSRKESVIKKIIAKEEKKRSRKELKNFYVHQIREGKMRHLVNLRQKFDEDKKKIEVLRQSRRYKPFMS